MATKLHHRRTMPSARAADVTAERERQAQIARDEAAAARKVLPKPKPSDIGPVRQSRGYKAVMAALKKQEQTSQKKSPVFRYHYIAPVTPAKESSPIPETSPLPMTPAPKKRPRESQADDDYLFRKRTQQHPLPVLHGMANLGNTCYIGAVLQVLTSLQTFSSDMQHPKLTPLSASGDSVFMALLQIIRDKSKANSTTILSPLGLKVAIAKYSKRFRGARQEDAHEFLVNLLDQVQEDTVPIHVPCQPAAGPVKIQLSESLCPTAQNFSCIVESRVECDGCPASSTVQDLFRDFSIDIPASKAQQDSESGEEAYDIQSLLQLYFKDETFEKGCTKCDAKECTMHKTIQRLPRVLVLHMKRFCFHHVDGERHVSKKNDCIKINPHLNLDFCCSSRTRAPIELRETEMYDRSAYQGESCLVREKCLPSNRLRLNNPILRLANQPASDSRDVRRGEELQDLTNFYHGMITGASPNQPSRPVTSKVDQNNVEDPDLQRALEESARESKVASQGHSSQHGDDLSPMDTSQEQRDLETAILRSLQEVTEQGEASVEEMNLNAWAHASQDVEQGILNTCKKPAVQVIDGADDENTPPRAEASTLYHLHGIIRHVGRQVSFGHFVADIYDSTRGQWFRHDDAVVSPIATADVFSKQGEAEGYIFFYVHSNFAGRAESEGQANLLPVDGSASRFERDFLPPSQRTSIPSSIACLSSARWSQTPASPLITQSLGSTAAQSSVWKESRQTTGPQPSADEEFGQTTGSQPSVLKKALQATEAVGPATPAMHQPSGSGGFLKDWFVDEQDKPPLTMYHRRSKSKHS